MNNRQAREMLALRRELDELRRSFELLRKTPPPTASSFARAAILQPVDEIPARVADGDDFDISHGPARIFDLLVRQGVGDWVMSEVKPSTGDGPRVELANTLDSALPDSAPVLGIQVLGQAWVPVMGGGGGGELYRFELTANFSTGTTVAATIKTMGGSTVGTGISLTDPEAIFLGLPTGSKGYCVLQGGTYYAIQAACAAEEGYV